MKERKGRNRESLKFRKECLNCKESFLAYRSTAKYCTLKCNYMYNYGNNPKYLAGVKRRNKLQYLRRKLAKIKDKRKLFKALLEYKMLKRKVTQK